MKICQRCGNTFESADWKCRSCGYEPPRVNSFFSFSLAPADQEISFEKTDFEKLFDLEGANFWFRSRNRLILWAVEKYFPRGFSFLEIGCGTGFVLSGIKDRFPNLAICGSDIYTEGLAFAARRVPAATLFQMDALDMPFESEFDIIGAFDVIEHIKDDNKALHEIWKSVKPGGGIIVTVPQHPFLWSNADVHAHHVRRYTRPELQTKMEKAGFKMVRITSFVSLIFPPMLISRLCDRRTTRDYDPAREFRISRPANKALEAILTLERSFIRAGGSFTCGGSLLAVAKKVN